MVTYAALRVESGQSLSPPNKRIPANNPLGIPVSWYGTMLGPNAVSRTLPQITLDRVWSVTPSLKILIIYHPPAIGRRVHRFDSSSDLPLARGVGAMGAAPPLYANHT